jgi:hypothetical protein
MDSEPHIVIPIKKVTLHFNEVVYPCDPYLPDVSKYACVNVIFIVNGVMLFGYYHSNGYFYTEYARDKFRGNEYTMYSGKPADKSVPQVTHWCYHTTDKVP